MNSVNKEAEEKEMILFVLFFVQRLSNISLKPENENNNNEKKNKITDEKVIIKFSPRLCITINHI